jgi:hypothetical protein
MANKTDIFVCVHLLGMTEAKLIGILSATRQREKENHLVLRLKCIEFQNCR